MALKTSLGKGVLICEDSIRGVGTHKLHFESNAIFTGPCNPVLVVAEALDVKLDCPIMLEAFSPVANGGLKFQYSVVDGIGNPSITHQTIFWKGLS